MAAATNHVNQGVMMSRSRFTTLLSSVFLIVASCSDPTMSSPALTASRDASSQASVPTEPLTLEWQARARALVSAGLLNPLAAERVYAAVSVAQYRAVNAVAEQVDTDGQLSENGLGEGGRSMIEAQRGAVAGASARVLSFLFPGASESIAAQVDANANAGRGGVHPHFERGVAIGTAAGDAQVAWLQTDGFTRPWTGTVPVGHEFWVPASLPPQGATFGAVRPYLMTSGSQFRPAPPPAFGSPEFNAAVNEVLTVAQNRTPEQIALARFWNFPAGTPTPPGHWNEIAAAYAAEQRLDESAAANLFAIMNAAMFDSFIACWEAKYFYWTLRPYQANPAITRVLAPPNHPSYPSGHACASAAASSVLSHFFPMHSSELSVMLTESGMSRLYAGIHYRFDMTAGNEIGTGVAQLALSRGL